MAQPGGFVSTSRVDPPPLGPASPLKEASMLYSILPTVVQSRIPTLPSIRRSVSIYGPTLRREAIIPKNDLRTPVQELSLRRVNDASGYAANFSTESISSDEDIPQLGELTRRYPVGMRSVEPNGGISWKYANQGMSLLNAAVNESANTNITHNSGFENGSMVRQLYIHALTYLLRALPSDLTTEEQMSVRSALPEGVIEPLRLRINGDFGPRNLEAAAKTSLLHRTLAIAIVQLFVFIRFVLPYIKCYLQMAYQYEREHKITEKLFAQGAVAADSIAKNGLVLVGALYGMGNGKVGQAITETIAWAIDGVSGGIHDGLSEGMAMVKNENESEKILENRTKST